MPKSDDRKNPVSPCLPDSFAEIMLAWYDGAKRDLPWRGTKDPYAVWVSEIMLQQTRVETVRDYYTRFLSELPGIAELSDAEEDVLMKLWQGLGYYSRVRNMARAAKKIMQEHGGIFPRSYEEIRKLPGIGDYTAGAVSSIACGLPTPAVDGNVERVLARLLGETLDRKILAEMLAPCYPPGRCGDFTQSLMELGATVCLPNGAPRCDACPLRQTCQAFLTDRISSLPAKKAKPERKIVHMNVFIVMGLEDGRILLRKRPDTGLLAGLWELPNCDEKTFPDFGVEILSKKKLRKQKHIFTHIEWHMTPYFSTCRTLPDGVPFSELNTAYPLPTAFSKILASAADRLPVNKK